MDIIKYDFNAKEKDWNLTKSCQASTIADHITPTGHNINWDHFEILATGLSDIRCIVESKSLLIKDLKPSLNENVGSEKLFLYWPFIYFPADFDRSVYYQFLFLQLSLVQFGSSSLLRMYVEA